jgi:hypothetical protein
LQFQTVQRTTKRRLRPAPHRRHDVNDARDGFRSQVPGEERGVIVAASTVAIVAIAAVVIVALIVLMYVVPRGGRRRKLKAVA